MPGWADRCHRSLPATRSEFPQPGRDSGQRTSTHNAHSSAKTPVIASEATADGVTRGGSQPMPSESHSHLNWIVSTGQPRPKINPVPLCRIPLQVADAPSTRLGLRLCEPELSVADQLSWRAGSTPPIRQTLNRSSSRSTIA